MQKAQDQRYDVLQSSSSSELGWSNLFAEVRSYGRGKWAHPLSRRPKSQSCLMDREAPPAAESVEAGGCRSTADARGTGSKEGSGAALGNPRNLRLAGSVGRAALCQAGTVR